MIPVALFTTSSIGTRLTFNAKSCIKVAKNPTIINGKCMNVPTKLGLVRLATLTSLKKIGKICSTRKRAINISTTPTKSTAKKNALIK